MGYKYDLYERIRLAGSNSSQMELPAAKKLSLISVNAALYAVAIAVTSPIPTPWGVGHFRPGVVIPAFFSVVFGPFIGGVGAAIGCFIGDLALSFFGLTTPLLSLIAGVPGNLIGFYVLGYLTSKRRSLSAFIISSFIALFIGNLVAALGVLAYFWFIVPSWAPLPLNVKFAITAGFTLFWLVTMIIFMIPLVPVIIRYAKPSLERMGFEGNCDLVWEKPIDIIEASFAVALILIAIYCLTSLIPGGRMIFAGVLPPETLLLGSAATLASGLAFAYLIGKAGKY